MADILFEDLSRKYAPSRALVVFDHFSGDWDRTPKWRTFKNGWNFFYEEENLLRTMAQAMPIDIVQLTERGLGSPII